MPTLKINKKLEPLFFKPKPIKVIIGGRGSGKSLGIGDILTYRMATEGCDIYCLREFQDSITDSVHKVFAGSIKERLCLDGWEIQKNTVIAPNGASTTYKGANRNPDAMQSAQGYKYSWFEEAHRASQDSIDKLLPTIIRNPGAECWFSANPQSSTDPFSLRFITPYLDELEASGYYEDELHLIIVANWRDNPWWNDEQEVLRKWDFENLSRAKYDWIWEGKFYDSVDHPLIKPEWFDACVDAHKKLGFEPLGIKYASHDPSDEGEDSKGYAYRHGSVVFDVQEMTTGDINAGGDWALGLATNQVVDAFTWDCDGMGVGLNRQVEEAFRGKNVQLSQYKGSMSVDFPESIYMPVEGIEGQKTNKQTFKNRRAQYYFLLRDRIHRTYLAVEKGKYSDPDTLVSFCSSISLLSKLKSELCRMPIKPNSNGMFELYTKEEMARKFKIKSPNLADSVKMLWRMPTNQINNGGVRRPTPINVVGRR